MPFLRVCLFSTALVSLASAQTLPQGLSREGDVVMMQPIPDGTSEGGAGLLSGPRPSKLRYLSAADHDLFVRAFEAASRGDWAGARALAAQGQSPVARQLVEWRYALDKNSGATFSDIDAVIKATEARTSAGTWPLRGTLQARAEAAITPDMAPATVIAWFGARTPNSSIGRIRLGEALVADGEKTKGAALIARGWAEGSFDPPIEQAILQKDAPYLTPESDRARIDALIWRGEITAARRELSRLDPATADIANARIALYSYGWPRAQAVVEKLSGTTDPGLLFDWAHALRLAGRDKDAHAILLRIPPATMVRDHPARWWSELSLHARDALASAEPQEAVELVRHAGFTSGDQQYADQQFLAGFITLRFLKTPSVALADFQKLDAAVSRPISKSRAQYWEGRAYEALGDNASALAHYRQAASWPETFYGQIALAHIEASPLLHLTDTVVEAAAASDVEADPLMPEIKVLADLGQEASLRQFIDRDSEVYGSPRHLKRLMILLNDWGYPEIAVRLAKTASYAGAPMPQFTHPLVALPAYPGPGAAPDPALVLGLIRQETEFDPYAISSAGARGLMQMMPASAKLAARNASLPFRPDALLSDTAYNIELGMTEYHGHMDRYGGSWVLAIASYNAGPGNVRKWLATNGDPRVTDPIDWIEQIPFGETRNYVQRVLENTEVYRARLAGKDVPLRILPDLYAPNPPNMPMLAAK
ncbi:MAG TPA: transglycosylase SLT domain-containing protein [Rhizomicrobium sp.]|nr:transglycosylase SLT domain-containing protein [Rhizomicrobium sp.]